MDIRKNLEMVVKYSKEDIKNNSYNITWFQNDIFYNTYLEVINYNESLLFIVNNDKKFTIKKEEIVNNENIVNILICNIL